MKKQLILLAFALIAGTIGTNAATRKELAQYYSSVSGLKKAELKTALSNLLKQHTVLSYGKGEGGTWWAFYVTDRTSNNMVINRYSDGVYYFATRGIAVNGMNIEHSMPKSWWGGSNNDAYKDVNHLYPSPKSDNSSKSNYPMALVTTVKKSSGEGYDKVGTGTVNGSTQQCWEPGDQFKGDFARTYMYMATCYQDIGWKNTGLQTLENTDWPTLLPWAQELYIEWATNDPVSDIETTRNDNVYDVQENRNPFIDFPNLMHYIWGDSIDSVFYPEYALTTASDDVRTGGTEEETETDTTEQETTIYYADCKTDYGSMTATNSQIEVWQESSEYGWQGTAYINKTNNAADETLTTPVIDLTNYKDVEFTFDHAVNFCRTVAPAEMLTVQVLCDGTLTDLAVSPWPAGTSWSFTKGATADISKFEGKKIHICFRYTSTTEVCPTWELKNVKVVGTKATNGTTSLSSSVADSEVARYAISGRRIYTPTVGINLVERSDGRVYKEIVR